MSLASLATGSSGTQKTNGLTGLASLGATKNPKKPDLSTIKGLSDYASATGFADEAGKIVNDNPKISFLQRIGAGLGAFNPAEAILTGSEKDNPIESVIGGGVEYVKDVGRGIATALTGTDYERKRRSFSDVADKLGIENKIAKFGVGFLGDVLLDPTTYFGGEIARGLGFAAKTGGDLTLKGIGKVAPVTEQGLRMAGEGIKDAAGKALVAGYKASKGAREDVLTFLSRKDKAQLAIAGSNLERLGTGTLSKGQQEELALTLASKRRAEFELGDASAAKSLEDYNKLFPESQVKDAIQAERALGGIDEATVKRISDIREEVDKLVAPFFNMRKAAVAAGKSLETPGIQEAPALKGFRKVDDLNRVIDGLKEQASKLRKERVVEQVPQIGESGIPSIGGEITRDEVVATHNKLIGYEEERLWNVIDDLSNRIEKLKNKPVTGGSPRKIKIPREAQGRSLTPTELAVYAERTIKNVINETSDKERLLQSVLDARSIGKKLAKGSLESGDYSAIEKVSPGIARTLRDTSSDPVVRKAMKQQLARVQKFAEDSDIDDPYTFYFPFIKKDSIV